MQDLIDHQVQSQYSNQITNRFQMGQPTHFGSSLAQKADSSELKKKKGMRNG